LYEYNKIGYAKMPTFTDEQIKEAKDKVKEYIKSYSGTYYMMLNHDIRYYTIYVKKSWKIIDEIFEIAGELGQIKEITPNEEGNAIEFWITDITGECHLYLFFCYDAGVVVA
jgi:hypothetical protein